MNRNSIGILTAVLLLTGCYVQQPVKPNDPYYAPVLSPSQRPSTSTTGSLYRENMGIDLFSDSKARRIGDIITIVLRERTVSSKSSNIEVTKDNEITIPEAAGGAGTVLGSPLSASNLSLLTDLTGEREFTGEADADQSNNLQGNITVTVVDVYPNGNLVVRGEKWLTLNRGDEYIRISGLVRPDDINPDNTVMSTKLANARISYAGRGVLADSQEMGWLSRFFNSPYWPF